MASQPCFTLDSPVEHELVIKKSRFLARIEPVGSSDDLQACLARLHAEYPDARHICFASLVNGQVSMSDDGEPSGTAAKPILNVLQHKQLDNVLASVVRYFGGIKLGAGGLVRAYSQAVSDPLNAASFSEVRTQAQCRVSLPFEWESLARRLAEEHSLSLHVEYGESVLLCLGGEQAAVTAWLDALSEPTRGAMQVLAGPEPRG